MTAWAEKRKAEVGDTEVDLDKAWHGIHYLLTGSVESNDTIASKVIMGGEDIGPDRGYGPAQLLKPAEVKAIAQLLEQTTPETLAKRYKPKEMTRTGDYPAVIWERDGDAAERSVTTNAIIMREHACEARVPKGVRMSISMYDVSIPIFVLSLNNLTAILDKAATHAEAKKVDPKALPATRLIVDMLPLSAQIQIACDTAKGAAARLAGVAIPKHEDTESTIPELKSRVAKTLEFIKGIKPEQLQGSETREIELKFPSGTLKFTGLNYLSNFVLPNFFFHMTMTYALLRKNGVELGKRDFLGPT